MSDEKVVKPITPEGTKVGRHFRKFIGYILIAGAVCLIMLQVSNVRKSVKLANELEQSPIEYSDWKADKAEYVPGDLIQFSYIREVKPQPKDEGVFVLSAEIFENTTTGEVFRGSGVFKKIKARGKEPMKAVRRLPMDCTPGKYVMQGLAQAQTSRATMTVGFVTEPFMVKAGAQAAPTKEAPPQ